MTDDSGNYGYDGYQVAAPVFSLSLHFARPSCRLHKQQLDLLFDHSTKFSFKRDRSRAWSLECLIAQASTRSQISLVWRAAKPVAALDAAAESGQIVLEKQLGETIVQDCVPPDRTWPSR